MEPSTVSDSGKWREGLSLASSTALFFYRRSGCSTLAGMDVMPGSGVRVPGWRCRWLQVGSPPAALVRTASSP